jgi:hypothetical protein
MPVIHELLAAEKTVNASWNTLHQETLKKLCNSHYFEGHTKSLKMLEDSAANEAIEAQAAENKAVPTNVRDTLHYALGFYGKVETLQHQKNEANRAATADLVFRGELLASALPVDQLLGLEARLVKVKEIFLAVPTLDASRTWAHDPQTGTWVAPPEHATKTEKVMVPVVLAAATDKHPAQVKESTRDNTVGKFTLIKRSGAATAVQKAEAIKLVDEMLVEVKQARMRANQTAVGDSNLGDALVQLLLRPFES